MVTQAVESSCAHVTSSLVSAPIQPAASPDAAGWHDKPYCRCRRAVAVSDRPKSWRRSTWMRLRLGALERRLAPAHFVLKVSEWNAKAGAVARVATHVPHDPWY